MSNPYDPPGNDSVDPPLVESDDTDPVLVAPVAEDARPRIVFAIIVPIMAILAATLVSLVLLAVVATIYLVMNGQDADGVPQGFEELMSQPWAFPLLIVPGQAVFAIAALGAALMSPLALRRRLDLTQGTMPKWTWFVMAAASPAAALPMGLLFHFFPVEPSEQLQALADLIIGQTGYMLIVTGFLVTVVPAVFEEALFRGYLQSRLLRRWSVGWAILFSAFIFSVAHVDPMHALGVFPLGVWLGVVAWRSGSIYPAMLGHFCNNLFSFVGAQFAEDMDSTELTVADLPIFAVLVGLMIFSLYLMFRKPPADSV